MRTPVALNLRKVKIPALPATVLYRKALVERLTELITGSNLQISANALPYKLILLHAPAGYGKTTLLSEVARQSPVPCCWYMLERSDSEPLIFVRTLLESLRQNFPTFGEHLIPLLSAAESTEYNYIHTILEALIETIVTEIPSRFALFLCHCQEISEYPEITQMIEYLLHHLPEQGILVLESREVPELDFASLLASRSMLGIGRDLLRLSPQEIQELAHVQGSRELSIEEAGQLAEAFDGWVTGLLLGTRLGEVEFLQRNWSAPLTRVEKGIEVHSQTLFSYVINEVFKRHQAMYAFLKEAVVLQEMIPELCADLLGISEAEASRRLHYLEQHGLFVTHSGEGTQRVYTCHPVLRDLLYEELRQQDPQRFVYLHKRAAELLSARQQHRQAIHHALEANVDEIAARLIITSAEQMMEQGYMEILQRWIAAFSETLIERYPRLLLIQILIYIRTGEMNKTLPLLERASELLNTPSPTLVNPEELPLLQAELALARASIWMQQGKHQQAQKLSQQVLEQLPADEVSLRALAHTTLGGCAAQLGEYTAEIVHCQKALQLWGRHTISRLTASGHTQLADAYRNLGHFALAEHHSARATACWEQLQDTRGRVNHLITRATILWDQGGLEEAEQLLQQALALASSPVRLHRMQGYALVNLGELYQDQGHYDRSLTVSEEGLSLARQLGDTWLLNFALLTLAMTYLYMGDAATAELLLSEMSVDETSEERLRPIQRVRRDLALGAILLHQNRYAEALALLEPAEAILRARETRAEQIKSLLPIAACYLGLQQPQRALHQLEMVEQILSTVDSYEWLVHRRLQLFPQLQRVVEQHPACASLRTLLHLDSYKTETTQEQRLSEGETEPEIPEILSPSLLPSPSAARETRISSPRLKIVALGEPAVLLDEQPITRWRMARAMELCFYLLECKRPMRKEQIITALWEEVDEQISQTFYSTVHYLRKALGSEQTIRSKGGIYTLDLASVYGKEEISYDVEMFEEQYARGKQALTEEDDETARAAFEMMIELYHGDYVQPFYSDWCNMRRDELRRLYLEAHEQLALLTWRGEEIEESAMHWQQMLAVDSCLEHAHYGLMRCYIRQGKRGLALRQYQRCKETLQQELGATPGAAIQKLYRRLMGLPKEEADSF